MTISVGIKNKFLLLSILVCLAFNVQSQTIKIVGIIDGKDTQQPLPGVFINVKNVANEKEIFNSVTNNNGGFSFANLKTNTKYQLKASFLGYSDLVMQLEGKNEIVDLGTLFLSVKSQSIGEAVVRGDPPTAIQKGDTMEINAAAFTTIKDASAEELVTKLPGISEDNGTLKAQGKEIKKILVDGKDFFGEDPTVALKNLPADVVDKIQLFDKLSEQAQFTGFDDGESVPTINIITKQEKKNGTFGKFIAGSNFDDKYIVGGNLNIFNKQRRISVVGLLNNINQQNFTQQDLESWSNNFNSKHDGGFSIGQQNGITTTRSAGINYSDNFGKKILVTGSYFFNSTKNYTDQLVLKDKFFSPKPDHFSNEQDTSTENKYNHRIHIRFEYDIDSANTLISTPKLTFQTNNSDKSMFKITTKNGGVFVNQEGSLTDQEVNSYNLENELVFRHKFKKERRTFSIAITTEASKKDPNLSQIGYYKKTQQDSISTNEFVDGNTDNYRIASNIDYIEPLGRISMLHFSLNNAYTNSTKDREAYNIDNNYQIISHLDSLSDIYRKDYFNNHIGVSYQIKTEGLKLSVGLAYQHSYLYDPDNSVNNKIFKNLLPSFLLNVKNPESSLRILYKTSTNAPSISQLQNVIDNTDRTNLDTGNPLLKQEYKHNLTINYSHADPDNSINYTFYLNADYLLNCIGNKIIIATKDTFINEVGFNLLKNIDLTYPVNIDHSYNIKSVFNFSFPLKFIQSKINLTTGLNCAQTPGYINENLNRYSLYSTSNGLTINSDISENIEFNLSYTVNYSIIKNSITTSAINANNNPKYLYQTVGAKFIWIFWKGIVIENDIIKQFEKGFLNFDQNYLLWNAYLGKKLFKDQNGEIKLTAFDILNQYRNVVHSVTPQYLKDTKTNNLRRYFMLTFTYNLKDYKDHGSSDKVKKNNKDHKKNKF